MAGKNDTSLGGSLSVACGEPHLQLPTVKRAMFRTLPSVRPALQGGLQRFTVAAVLRLGQLANHRPHQARTLPVFLENVIDAKLGRGAQKSHRWHVKQPLVAFWPVSDLYGFKFCLDVLLT